SIRSPAVTRKPGTFCAVIVTVAELAGFAAVLGAEGGVCCALTDSVNEMANANRKIQREDRSHRIAGKRGISRAECSTRKSDLSQVFSHCYNFIVLLVFPSCFAVREVAR